MLSAAMGSVIGGLGGGLLSGLGGYGAAAASARAAEAMTNKQIEWERERATHAHQWEVQDLKAAGLNPILSAGGKGATTGGISAPLPDTSGIAQAGGSLGEALRLAMEIQKNQAEVTNLGANSANLNADTATKNEQKKLIMEQTISELARRGLMSAQTASTELKNIEQQFQNERLNLTYWNDFINKATGSAKNLAEAGKGITDMLFNKLAPKKGDKGYKEFQEFGKNWKETTRIYN